MAQAVCKVDGNTFSHASSFSYHRNAAHSTKDYSCNVCSRKFKSPKTLQVHKTKCHEASPSPYQCQQCEQKFTESGPLKRHVKADKINFTCAVADCGRIFNRKDVLQKHYKRCKSRAQHSTAVEDGIQREKMNIEFSIEATKFSEIFEQFTKDKSTKIILECQICGSTFNTKDSLKVHKNKYHSKEVDRTNDKNKKNI